MDGGASGGARSPPVPGQYPGRVGRLPGGLRRRHGLSYEVIEKAAAKLPSRSGRSRPEPLPKSTVGEIVTGKRLPAKGKLLTFLTVCEVARPTWPSGRLPGSEPVPLT
jgi:hypothetical protein